MQIILSILVLLFAHSLASAQVLYFKDGKSVSITQVCAGLVDGAECIVKPMVNNSASTSTETIWDGSVAYSWPSSATASTISSSSANDASAGTGCRTVKVKYLTTAYVAVTETLTMNGQTAVNLGSDVLAVNDMTCETVGSGAVNAGTIYVGSGSVTSGVPATKYDQIPTGYGRSHSGFYTMAADKVGVLRGVEVSVLSTGQYNFVTLFKQDDGKSWQNIKRWHFQLDSVIRRTFDDLPIFLPAKSRIRFDQISQTSNTNPAGEFSLIEFDTDKFDLTRFISVN